MTTEEGDTAWVRPVDAIGADTQVIDARPLLRFTRGHAPDATRLSWTGFRDGWGRTGSLAADLSALRQRLLARGLDAGRDQMVYGDAAAGWGEEGRIVWMLRYLGFPRAAVLDGGWAAWRPRPVYSANSTRDTTPGPRSDTGGWPRDDLRASIDDVQRAVDAGGRDTLLLDTRSLAEWRGGWRYLPARRGRIPHARHLEWHTLLDARGHLDRSGAPARLAALGITPDRPIIAYCVGGVRSAHALVMLRALGFRDVRNYDGSWYQWARDRSRPIDRSHPSER